MPRAVKIYTCADDHTMVVQHTRVDEAAIQLQIYLCQLEDRQAINHMLVECSKSPLAVVAPFTMNTYNITTSLTLMGQSTSAEKNVATWHYHRG